MELAVLKKTDFLGKSLSVFGTPDEPLFFAKEIADILEHSNSRKMIQSVDPSEKVLQTNVTNGYGGQNAWFLTEYGLYELLMQSRKPIAKQFKQGIKQILKDIRQKGFYAAPSATADTERIIDTLIDAYNTQKHRISTLERQLSEATTISYPSKMNALTLPTNKSTNQSTNKTTNRAVPQSHRLTILQEVRYDNQDFYIYATADGTLLIYAKDAVRYLGLSTDHVKRYVTQYVRPENRIHANHPCDYRFGHRTHFITQGGLSDLYHRYRTLSPSTSKPFYDYFFPLLTAPVYIIE